METSATLTKEKRETDQPDADQLLEPATARHERAAEMAGSSAVDWASQPPLSPEMEPAWAEFIEHTYGLVDQE